MRPPIAPTDAEALTVLRASAVFAGAAPADLAHLAGLARQELYPVRALLVARGARPDRLWCVLEGAVELGLYAEDGRPALLGPILPGGWATWLGCFHPAPMPHDLWTVPATRLLAFPAAAVRDLAAANPGVQGRVIERIGERMRELIGWTLAAGLSDPERRLAYLLAVISRGLPGPAGGPAELSLTHDRLAAMGLGSRQRVARLLTRLAARGLVELRYGRVLVRSRKRLEAFGAA